MNLNENPTDHSYRQHLMQVLGHLPGDKEAIADSILEQGEIGEADGRTRETAVVVSAPDNVVAILLCKAWLTKNYPEATGSRRSLGQGGKFYDNYTFTTEVRGAKEIWFDLVLTG